jgi:DNA replication protein DnaC
MLSDEQSKCTELLLTNKSCFFKGKAGTGKSFLLAHAYRKTKERNGYKGSTFITAPTGRYYVAFVHWHLYW